MIEGVHAVWQAVLGTAFTWAVTAAGSGLVFFISAEVGRVSNVLLSKSIRYPGPCFLAWLVNGAPCFLG